MASSKQQFHELFFIIFSWVIIFELLNYDLCPWLWKHRKLVLFPKYIFFSSSLSMLEQDCWLIFWWCFYIISCAWHHTEHFTHIVFYWHRGTSPVLLKPKTTHEVSEILAYCNSRRLVLFIISVFVFCLAVNYAKYG